MSRYKSFPNIKPASRSYTPGVYPQVEFSAQNGAKTVIRYGNKKVNSKLSLGFTNITDEKALEILNFYEEINSDYDFIFFSRQFPLVGVSSHDLARKMREKDTTSVKLRYRFDGPPTVTSVRPGFSNVQCKFVACLDGD